LIRKKFVIAMVLLCLYSETSSLASTPPTTIEVPSSPFIAQLNKMKQLTQEIDQAMSFNATQFREVIESVLHYLEPEIPFTPEAVELLMLTSAQETFCGKYFRQVKGPARGFFQVEPNTEKGLVGALKEKGGTLNLKIEMLMLGSAHFPNMVYSIPYQVAIARYFYFLKPGSIPTTIEGMAEYYKKYYNTYLGKATVAEAIANYRRYAQ
jgi:hypothetical protein